MKKLLLCALLLATSLHAATGGGGVGPSDIKRPRL